MVVLIRFPHKKKRVCYHAHINLINSMCKIKIGERSVIHSKFLSELAPNIYFNKLSESIVEFIEHSLNSSEINHTHENWQLLMMSICTVFFSIYKQYIDFIFSQEGNIDDIKDGMATYFLHILNNIHDKVDNKD